MGPGADPRAGRPLRVRISELAGRASYELSGGQKQRLVLAASLAMQPPVLVLDEPTAELDPVGRAELLALLRELADTGVAVVIAEQATSTGAGDAFDAAFIAAEHSGMPAPDALRFANAAAGLAVRQPGARTMPEWADIEQEV